MNEHDAWTSESKRIDTLDIEICFQLAQELYTGGPNNGDQLNDRAFYEALKLPDFPRAVDAMAQTSEIVGHEHELIAYYERLLKRSKALKYDFKDIRHYFWMRMRLWNSEQNVCISFPWYDTFSEMLHFLDWLEAPDLAAFDDIEQGWQLVAVSKGGFVHLRQTNPDSEKQLANVAVPKETLSIAAKQAEQRARAIIERLEAAFGVDVWTSYVSDVEFSIEVD